MQCFGQIKSTFTPQIGENEFHGNFTKMIILPIGTLLS